MVMTIGVAMVASIAQMMVLNMQQKMGASFAQEMMQLLVVTQMVVILYNSLLIRMPPTLGFSLIITALNLYVIFKCFSLRN